jgi:hypothetical protein
MKYLYNKKFVYFLVDKDMATINRLRAEQVNRLVLISKEYAATKNRKITTIDPILRVGKELYPTLTNREQLELSQTALRIILNEVEAPSYQTTLFAHI